MDRDHYKPRLISLMSASFLLFLLFLSSFAPPSLGRTHRVATEKSDTSHLQTYIVHVEQPGSTTLSAFSEREKWYKSFLPVGFQSLGESRLLYSYSSVISGFAARLTHEELLEMRKKTGFVHAYPDRILPLRTTHTPNFLGLNQNGPGFWNDSRFGQGVIVGVLDTGVSPNHPSFRDEGMPPPPSKWKGVCEFNASDCNNKLIGARDFVQGLKAMRSATRRAGVELQGPYDYVGHGTHTASTATGMFVGNANVDGQANGTASGIAPFAHLAVYKVCGVKGCADSDVLAGMDSAIEDGVDVLSISLGGSSLAFYNDSIAIGAFGAVEKGVFVSCAAGNDGPSSRTLSNEAPWILTVGASTLDRVLRATVVLGSGDKLDGESVYQPGNFPSTSLPLVYLGVPGSNAAYCVNGSLDGIDVNGKMVVCDDGGIDRVKKGEVVKKAGGSAMVIANLEVEGFTTLALAHVLPASHVSYSDGVKIKAYINSSSAPTAAIAFKGTLIGISPAPVVGFFSSRGPSQASPNILKPDIIGPGVNILAAWPFQVGLSGTAASMFSIISGTSMATPHLSGIAALLKSAHPDWSPAAIKSATMTSSDIKDTDGNSIADETLNVADFFAIGAGHVNPSKAASPGLIYDIEPDNYIGYLCGLNYTDAQVGTVARRRISCSDVLSNSSAELNYPSFMILLDTTNSYNLEVARTVTNVGSPSSEYTVQVESPMGISVTVKPETLSFSKANEKVQFSVSFNSFNSSVGSYSEGYLTWVSSDKNITARSPIMVSVQ